MRSFWKRSAQIMAVTGVLCAYKPILADSTLPEVADPAAQVIEELLAAHQTKAEAPAEPKVAKPLIVAQETQESEPAPAPLAPAEPASNPTLAAPAQPTTGIDPITANRKAVDDIISGLAADQQARNQAESKKLLDQAVAAKNQGRTAAALRLANRSVELDPDNQQATTLVGELKKSDIVRKLTSSFHSRAKAHLASGLTRGQELMQDSQYRAAEDLLKGVVEASDLFPGNARVEIYRRLAQRELNDYQSAVKSGRIVLPPNDQEADAEPVKLAADQVTVPANMKRLLRGSEGRVPSWYAMQKTLLNRNVSVAYKRQPIAMVLDDLAEQSGVTFVVDEPVLQSHATVNARLDLRVSEIPAEKVLDLACLKAGLEYVIMEKAVVVTTPSKALEYVRELPVALKNNWAASRVLFPSLNPELLANQPLAAPEDELADEVSIPSYLRSGAALVEDIRKLLR